MILDPSRTLTANSARADLYGLLDEAADSHELILINGKGSTAVLISEQDWRSTQQTLHRLSIPACESPFAKA